MKFLFRHFLLATIVSALIGQHAGAQVSNENPTGPAGDYNGIVSTAGSYDPLTGNASRVIDDIVVAGAVGAYPLKWTRRMNTRALTRPDTFGHGGGWSHSYQWELAINHPALPTPTPPNWPPDERPDGVLTYPDGRSVNLDTPYSQESIPAAEEGPYGTRDRFQDLHDNNGNYDLQMADGGVVKFNKLLQDPQHPYCRATAIVDPYGLITTLSYDGQGRLEYITEPGSNPRYLRIYYGSHQWHLPAATADIDLIDRVEANDGFGHVTQSVDYGYTEKRFDEKNFLYLTGAAYNGGDHAAYDYQASNRLPLNQYDPEQTFFGIIKTCDDDRFAGPMKRIKYELRPRSSYYGAAYGEIWQEQNAMGYVLSELEIPQPPIPGHPYARREHRGNAVRTFYYDNSLWLSARSDFQDHWAYFDITFISTSRNVCHFTDERSKTTDKLREGDFQLATRVTFPDTEGSYVETLYEADPARPLYVKSRQDERGNITNYIRNTDHSVQSIHYPNANGSGRDYPEFPDSPSDVAETFTYNALRQIETHGLTNGGTEHCEYDARGLKQTSWPPATPSDLSPETHKTKYFYYTADNSSGRFYLIDRLWYMEDPLHHKTFHDYNERGQVTRVTHQDNTFTQSQYKNDSTLDWVEDELRHRTTFVYDEYKRVTHVTKVVNGVEETTTTDYTPIVNGVTLSPLSHTTSAVYQTTSPQGKKVDYDYDSNFRRTMMRQAPGTADEATTWSHYDPAGNLDWGQDAQQYVTNYGYDERNRQTTVTRNTSPPETTTVEYDRAGNKIKETRQDQTLRSWDYDSMNRLHHAYDWRTNQDPTPSQTTTNTRDAGGRVRYITDTKGAIYTYLFDWLDRKTIAGYPIDANGATRRELWHYDVAGNLDEYTNPAGQIKRLHYDNRNRMDASLWDNNAGPQVVTRYDAASRVVKVLANSATIGLPGTMGSEEPSAPDDISAETMVAFEYDEANRKIWEDQTLAGYPTRRVKNELNRDGLPINLQIMDPQAMGAEEYYYWPTMQNTSYLVNYDYTARNQLKSIQGEDWSFDYSYGPRGSMTARTAHYIGSNGAVTSSTNCPMEHYDALNRPTTWEQTGLNGTFAYSEYQYDQVNREQATRRWEDQGRGERFTYEPTNQLKTAVYDAQNVFTSPTSAMRSVSYAYPLDKLNRTSVTETLQNGLPAVTNYSPNALNQYQSVGGQNYSYDTNFNLAGAGAGALNATYDAANHLVSATHSAFGATDSAHFVYDGLGRCVKRTMNGYDTVFAFDGWKEIAEWDEWHGSQAWNVYGPGADEILLRYNSGDKIGYVRFALDRHGNVAFLIDNDGVLVEKYTYDAFGKVKITNPSGNGEHQFSYYGHRFMFQGRDYIHELGIYDYRNRFYRPELGRFLQTDPKGFDAGDMNLFRYVGDDPVDLSDPLGLDSDIYLNRDYADRNAPGTYRIVDRGRSYIYRANENPFYKNTQGVRAGDYVLKSKGKAWGEIQRGDYPADQPGITGKAPNLKPGQPNNTYKSAALVHRALPVGAGADSAGCVTVCSDAEKRTKEIVARNERNHETTNFHIREPAATTPPTQRAKSMQERSGDSGGLGGEAQQQAATLTAAQIDAAHQATGVPSLGAESVNFAPGKP